MLKLNTIVEYMKKPFYLNDLSDVVKKKTCVVVAFSQN